MTFLMKKSCGCKRAGCIVLWTLAFLFVQGRPAYAATPLLVAQPSYVNMQFYVHQPQGIPQNWYATFDGYPVWKNAEGIWHYGSYSGSTLSPTNYIVGSVVPSIVGIMPCAAAASATMIPNPSLNPNLNLMPASWAPQPMVSMLPVPAAFVAAWQLDPRFMALGLWKGNVDRVGLLRKPAVPVAWRGNMPKVIYAWTGANWYQMVASEGERPGDVLRNNLYVLTRLVNQNGPSLWYEPNVSLLVSQAGQWGFFWMGEIGPVQW
ncbi:MAG: hypothetical protein LBT15_00965 [Synergistaceae bacterium]|nr:hypothetical protein [Synergistaceae bacterium]